MPEAAEWLLLAVSPGEGDDADRLLALAAPGPTLHSWDLGTGRYLGPRSLAAWEDGSGRSGATGWCGGGDSGRLYRASASPGTSADSHGGVQLRPVLVPAMI
mmetsp:Transcript_97926/g.305393  ORF Transcript_97926/g.305393 Transcript_97926/m.305393 type:complete len:102 (+) Transcript_97926:422-727(+)